MQAPLQQWEKCCCLLQPEERELEKWLLLFSYFVFFFLENLLTMGNLPKPTSTVGTASKLLLAAVAKSKPEDISDWLATGPLKGGAREGCSRLDGCCYRRVPCLDRNKFYALAMMTLEQ